MSHLVKFALGVGLVARGTQASQEAFTGVTDCWKQIVEDRHAAGDKLDDNDMNAMQACCSQSAWQADDLDDIVYSAQDDLYVQFQAQEVAAENLCKQKMENTYKYLKNVGRTGQDFPAGVAAGAANNAQMDIMLQAMRKFRNLKAMVMVLQPVNITIFGRYCYYGCWCLPNGQHNLAQGFGQPVDPIDEVCKEFALCYKCIDIDFAGQCDQEKRGYQWARNRVNGVTVDVTCKNDPAVNVNHRCARYLCECDRILAVGLGMFHWHWNISFHARWGSFDRLANCFPGGGDYRQDACCGGYGTATDYWGNPNVGYRRPYASSNPATACCQDVYYYDFLNQDCCLNSNNDVEIVDKGTCNNQVLNPDDDQYTTVAPNNNG